MTNMNTTIDPTDSGLFDVAVALVFASEKLESLADAISTTEQGRSEQIREARDAMRNLEESLRELSCTEFCDILAARAQEETNNKSKPSYCRTVGRS